MSRTFDRSDRDPALSWRVLAVLNLYRILVPLVLVGLYSLGGARGIGVKNPQLFLGTAVFYLLFGLGSVIFVLVCLSTSNTLLMSVMERVREIGTLLALGTSRAQVAVLVLCEALWLGLLGALAGDALALGIGAAIRALRAYLDRRDEILRPARRDEGSGAS